MFTEKATKLTSKQLNSLGIKARKQGNLEKAIELFELALKNLESNTLLEENDAVKGVAVITLSLGNAYMQYVTMDYSKKYSSYECVKMSDYLIRKERYNRDTGLLKTLDNLLFSAHIHNRIFDDDFICAIHYFLHSLKIRIENNLDYCDLIYKKLSILLNIPDTRSIISLASEQPTEQPPSQPPKRTYDYLTLEPAEQQSYIYIPQGMIGRYSAYSASFGIAGLITDNIHTCIACIMRSRDGKISLSHIDSTNDFRLLQNEIAWLGDLISISLVFKNDIFSDETYRVDDKLLTPLSSFLSKQAPELTINKHFLKISTTTKQIQSTLVVKENDDELLSPSEAKRLHTLHHPLSDYLYGATIIETDARLLIQTLAGCIEGLKISQNDLILAFDGVSWVGQCLIDKRSLLSKSDPSYHNYVMTGLLHKNISTIHAIAKLYKILSKAESKHPVAHKLMMAISWARDAQDDPTTRVREILDKARIIDDEQLRILLDEIDSALLPKITDNKPAFSP
ncbi:MAG: hypothetical protein JXR42_02970 [Gammaproteobacteria bacterium]|nr:hypothetical protein [Gammaproteobacteria bacterium]